MPESEVDQDAEEARRIGPPVSTQEQTPAPGGQARRTPRWVWAWTLPLVLVIFLYLARGILGPFVIAAVLAYIFSMVVDQIQERLKWPRALIVTLMYLVALGAIGLGLYFSAEALYQQTRDFVARGPNIIEQALRQFIGNNSYSFGGDTFDARTIAQKVTTALSTYFGNGGGGDALHLAQIVVGRLLDTLLVIIVSFYFLLSGKQIGSYFLKFVPADSRARTGYVAGRIHTVLGAYLRGQLLLIVLMSAVSFLVLQFVFKVPYALPIGIITGFLEILPLIGPAMAAVLASGVALSAHGAGAAVGVLIAYLILRELEDNLVMPFVVGRAVEIHPVATIFAVLAGGAVAGVIGMLLAVPAAAMVKVILDFLYPTDPDKALAQARPGMKIAEKEAEARDEPAPKVPSEAKS
ncbi:MAG: AI-2E family transporter [Chloroflexi bacterium]|nr:AI-2E family transporter [Chloroflexota bacterium]